MVAVKYPFSQKIRCGYCGTQYVRGQIYSSGEMVPAWWCYSRRRSQKLCSQRGISEKSIENAFVQCLNELISNIDEIKGTLKTTITNVLVDVPLDELNGLDEQIRNLQREMMELHVKKTSGRIILDDYAKLGSKLAEKIDALKTRKNEILETQYTNKQIKQRLNDINKVLDEHKPNKKFDSYLFKKLIDEITINDRNKLTFNLE